MGWGNKAVPRSDDIADVGARAGAAPGPGASPEASARIALEALHEDAWRWALACCRGDREAALDALHDAYVAVLDGRAGFAGRSSFKTWLFGVVRNMARSALRRRGLRALVFAPLELARDASAAPTQERATRTRALDAALKTLSGRQRELTLLVFVHDFTLSEAAQALGLSIGSARTHYERAKARLRAALNVKEDGDDRHA